MESANKVQHLGHALKALQTEREDLIRLMRSFDDDALSQSPGEGVWSPLEVLRHIIISEEGSLKYVQKKLSFNPKLSRATFFTDLRYVILLGGIYSPFRFKAPAVVVPIPAEYDLESLVSQWQNVAKELQTYFRHIDPRWLDYEVYKHPLAGRLSLIQMVGFLKHHLLRHKKQIVSRLPSVH